MSPLGLRISPEPPGRTESRSAYRYNVYSVSCPTNIYGKILPDKSISSSWSLSPQDMMHGCQMQKISLNFRIIPVPCLVSGNYYDANTGRPFPPCRKHIHDQRFIGAGFSASINLLKVTVFFQVHFLFHTASRRRDHSQPPAAAEKTKGHRSCGLMRITAFFPWLFWRPEPFCRWTYSFSYGIREPSLSVCSWAEMSFS